MKAQAIGTGNEIVHQIKRDMQSQPIIPEVSTFRKRSARPGRSSTAVAAVVEAKRLAYGHLFNGAFATEISLIALGALLIAYYAIRTEA